MGTPQNEPRGHSAVREHDLLAVIGAQNPLEQVPEMQFELIEQPTFDGVKLH